MTLQTSFTCTPYVHSILSLLTLSYTRRRCSFARSDKTDRCKQGQKVTRSIFLKKPHHPTVPCHCLQSAGTSARNRHTHHQRLRGLYACLHVGRLYNGRTPFKVCTKLSPALFTANDSTVTGIVSGQKKRIYECGLTTPRAPPCQTCSATGGARVYDTRSKVAALKCVFMDHSHVQDTA